MVRYFLRSMRSAVLFHIIDIRDTNIKLPANGRKQLIDLRKLLVTDSNGSGQKINFCSYFIYIGDVRFTQADKTREVVQCFKGFLV